MPKKITPNISQKFAKANQLRVEDLNDRIAFLEAQLAGGKQSIQKIPLGKIKINPNQPRKSFYIVERKVDTLRKDGQKTPIILTEPPNANHYQIFDGECRYRAAIKLEWDTIDAIVIPHDEDTYDIDVLVSAIYDDGLNSLDLSEAIVKEVQKKLPAKDSIEIATKLNSTLVRLRRNGEQKKIKGIEKRDFEEQQEILQELNLQPEELVIFSTILYFRLNLFSVSNHKFPFLKLAPEIKQAIRDRGLGESQARALDSIKTTNKNLDISAKIAEELRRNIIARCLVNHLDLAETKKEIKNATAPYLKESKPNSGKVFKKIVSQIEAFQIDELNEVDRSALVEVLKETIKGMTSS